MRIQTNFLRGSAPTKSVDRHVQCVALNSLAFGITSDIFFKLVLKNVDEKQHKCPAGVCSDVL